MSRENELKRCPFCGDGETRIVENKMWTGQRYNILSVEIRHWCHTERLQGYLVVKGTDKEDAIKNWNTRAPELATVVCSKTEVFPGTVTSDEIVQGIIDRLDGEG